VILALPVGAQNRLTPDWRAVGNQLLESSVPGGLTSGAVARVWFSADGARLYARLDNGQVLENTEDDTWEKAKDAPAPPAGSAWEKNLKAKNWAALTEYRGYSIIGAAPVDAAISPVDGDDLVVANGHGLWRSLDGGDSWTSLNAGLPNFPGRRIIGVPGGGAAVLLNDGFREARWQTGEKQAWRVVASQAGMRDNSILNALEPLVGERPTRAVVDGNWRGDFGVGRFGADLAAGDAAERGTGGAGDVDLRDAGECADCAGNARWAERDAGDPDDERRHFLG
jgi:hypothetical protein